MRWIVLVIVMAGLAGCAASPSEPVQDTPVLEMRAESVPVEGPRTRAVEAPPARAPAALEVGLRSEIVFGGACDGTCQVLSFGAEDVPAPAASAWVDARVYWDGTASAGFRISLVQEGEPVSIDRRGYDLARAVAWEPRGVYHVVVEGAGEFTGNIRLRHTEVPAVPGGDLLPNLVTLTPIELYLGQCYPEEQAEEGASRCLRLGNAVGNVGDGPLEVHLDYVQGAMAAAGLGRFTQRVYTVDGFREHGASGAEIHPSHGHFHYEGLAHFALYKHDVETGLRGDQVGVGVKRGFCFLDWGDMEHPEAPSGGQQRAEQECLIPDPAGGWSMGITRGMYDYYWPELADQYIDIPGVPDGVYELVSIADGANTLEETDETDNDAALLIHIEGGQVSVLEVRALYDNPESA